MQNEKFGNTNKVDIAKKHIEAAILMLSENFDPVPIHTVAMHGQKVLRDLCRHNSELLQHFEDRFISKKFWQHVDSGANYFKHATRKDEPQFGGFHVEANDLAIFLAIQLFKEHTQSETPKMKGFCLWFATIFPECFPELEDLLNKSNMLDIDTKNIDRDVRLAALRHQLVLNQ